MSATTETATQAGQNKPAAYTAVVYFHGMGSQRRYEETSHLVDQIDRYLGNRARAGDQLGQLRSIKARVEPLHPKLGQSGTVSHLRAKLVDPPLEPDNRSLRFYEVYWAPIMAEQKSPWGVLKWIFRQPFRPLDTLNSPWRERQRLRRAVLAAMFEGEHATATPEQKQDYRDLLELYDDFDRADQAFPAGSFDDFLSFIREHPSVAPDAGVRLQLLARRWQSQYRQDEVRNAVLLATMALALLLLGGGALLGIFVALKAVLGLELVPQSALPFAADWKSVLAVAGFLAAALGLTRFLSDYMGDVQAWATYEETDAKHMARSKVIDRSLEVLSHVLLDDACTRVAVVAHSLGTSVAHDALLALSRRNRAYNPADPMTGMVDLSKIEHFVTMGSPIDKIEYFFESYVSNSHRYKRVVEDLRGDIGTEPFKHNTKPFIHWINFWDEGDPISGPLHSPASAKDFAQRVDNIHVASYRFPMPAASHAGYFHHRTVIDCLYRVIGLRAASFQTLTLPGPKQQYPYESVYLGPGEPLGARMPFVVMALAIPWLALLAIVLGLLGAVQLAFAAGGLGVTFLVLLAIGLIASRAQGHRMPI
jgi:hypothetical protein